MFFSRERHCSCPQKLLDALSHIPSYGILYAKNREFPDLKFRALTIQPMLTAISEA